MKALLFLVGLVFIVAGVVTGVMSQMDYGNALIGLNLGLAATLLVGGFVVMGLASALGAISSLANTAPQGLPSGRNTMHKTTGHKPAGDDDMPFPAATAAVGATAGAAGMAIGSAFDKTGDSVDAAVDKVAEVANEAKENVVEAVENVTDTVGDLADEAKGTADSAIDDVAEVLDDAKDAATESVDEVNSESDSSKDETTDQPETEGKEGENGDQLYIVEEVEIRGKAARVLSDNTVEAETEEGWMRFENIEHLEEYLDAMDA